MVLESIGEWKEGFTQIMNTGLVKNNYFYIDLWSVGHIILGMTLMYIIVKYKIYSQSRIKQYLLVIFLAITWEIYEWIFYSRGLFFSVDTKTNVAWDIIFGLIGAKLYIQGEKAVNKEIKVLENK